MQSKTMRHRFTGAIALTALVLMISVMAAPKSITQEAVSDAYDADYLILNPELD